MDEVMKAKKTQVEMVHDRGFVIPDNEQFILTITDDKPQVKKLKALKVNQYYTLANNNDVTLYVHYSPEDKLIDSVKAFVKQMATHTHGIFIGDDEDLKNITKKQYQDHLNKLTLKNIQLFTYDELSFNVIKHVYQPTFQVVDASLIIPSLANANQLPLFLKNDPVVKYYDWPAGTVIKVTETLYLDDLVDQHVSFSIVTNKIKTYK